jgi:Barstar (barnase inhibitor)
MASVRLDSARITDWASFHAECRRALGFPEFYGANMNAWIDCMSSLDEDDGMVGVQLQPGDLLRLEVPAVEALAARAPEVVSALVECTGFVNRERYAEPRIALVFT